MAKSNILVCIPCYNSEDTIEDMVESLLAHSNADILLVDDSSNVPLESFIPDRFANQMDRIQIVRPAQKVFSGGGKNLGIWKAIEEDYAYLILLDSDLELPHRLVSGLRNYLQKHPNEVLVAPSINPAGNRWQYADTMINFSTYLPSPGRKMSPKNCLAGYAFALNMRIYRQNPVFHRGRYGGEDVLYFHDVMERFDLDYLPMLNEIAVRHLPPRATRQEAAKAQQRYGKAFFSHNDGSRERLFSSLPWMHFLTPRFILMVCRLVHRRRFSDLRFAPCCWYLDFRRAMRIVQLHRAGYADPDKGVDVDNAEVARSAAADSINRDRRHADQPALTTSSTGV